MMNYEIAWESLQTPAALKQLASLYSDADWAKERYEDLIAQHQQRFGCAAPLFLLSAPGRAEIIGNHTDHNAGFVLAAAVQLDIAAAVSPRDDFLINLFSEGYDPLRITLENLIPQQGEAGTTAALLRGVASGMRSRGLRIGGFDAVMNSSVLSGSGLSSSAAFEMLACAIFETLFSGFCLEPLNRAKIGQYAENAYFMKPSGLMDQTASSFGGLSMIDFGEDQARVETLSFSFHEAGYAVVVVNTQSSHDGLTAAYSAIPFEMKAAAKAAGGKLLRDVPYQKFMDALREVRREAGDRAVLRALHFYRENQRVLEAAEGLKAGDIARFFKAVNESGISSWTLLQNISHEEQHQPMALALALAKGVLGDRGACRVHGGGFAGTTLNFVPLDLLAAFSEVMEQVFGPNCCQSLDVRGEGPVLLSPP
jgi:galactokinase